MTSRRLNSQSPVGPDLRLARLMASGASLAEISRQLNRTVAANDNRARKLKILRASIQKSKESDE
jgi:hypothetical protein